MKQALIAMIILLGASLLPAQITVFSDDFSQNLSDSWTSGGQIGSSGFTVNRSGDDWAARRSSSTQQLELTNDAGSTANAAGWIYANSPVSGFGAPYSAILASNTGLVTWSFNLRQIRTDPAGFGSGNYGVAFILASSSQSVSNTGSGYAVVLGQSGSTDPLRLARFSGGLSSGLTNIISSNTTGLTDFGTEYLSVRVNYDPETNDWALYVRNDGSSSFSDPQSGSLTLQGTAVDASYTSSSLAYAGCFWQGSTSAGQTAFFDNVSIQVTPYQVSFLNVEPLELTGFEYILNNGPSDEQSFTVSGSDLASNILIAPTDYYEVSTASGVSFIATDPIELVPASGSVPPTTIFVRLKAGLAAGNYLNEALSVSTAGTEEQTVICSGSVLLPGINVNPATLSGFTYMSGLGPSQEQVITVSGQNIYADVSLSAPAHFEISATSGSGFGSTLILTPSGSNLPATDVHARLKSDLSVGVYTNEQIVVSSSGAANQTITCSGEVISGAAPLAPTALPATTIAPTGFTANWTASDNAGGYRLDVFSGSPVEDLFFSEYIEGSSYNKAIEIFNGTGASVDLSDYTLYLYSNGGTTPNTTLALEGFLANNAVYVIAHSSANAQILAAADVTSGVANHNGDDTLGLWKESTASYVDIFGRIGEDPGDFWGTDPLVTKDKTLVRKSTVGSGISTNPASGFPTLSTEWESYPMDTSSYLGSHVFGSREIVYVPGYQNLSVGNVTSYPVTGLEESTQYKYVVRAANIYGTSVNSNEIEVTTTSSTAPAIYVSGSLNPFSTSEGTPSAAQDYTMSSANLTENILITIPSGFEISTDGGNNYAAGSTSVSPSFAGSVLVKLSGSASGTYSGSITHASSGAGSVSLSANGVVTSENITAPTIQAYNITGYPAYTSMSLEWSPGNGAYRVVKINTSNSFSPPSDGTSPAANTFYTGAGEQVIYNGATQYIEGSPFNGCTVTNLTPSTTYWFRVYEYNGTGLDSRYLSSAAANNPRALTTTSSPGTGYYSGIYGYGSTLKGLLHTLLKNTHTTQFSYTALINQLQYTDEDPSNTDNLIEIYTGWSVPKSDFGNEVTDWNREHTWSKSHGDFGDVAPAGTDLHHLRPCDSTVNMAKSNKDFDEGGTPYTDNSPPSGYSGNTGCSLTYNTWEPRDEDKGDVARMIMYMAVRYEGDDSNYAVDLELVDHDYSDESENLPYYGVISTLLRWHQEDPPDAWEARRNNRIGERQGNRNPFIDIPGYAARIWAPCPLYSTDVSTTGFTGNWSVPLQATDYFLQVATDSLFTNLVPAYANLDVNLAASMSVTGLAAGGTYYYRLRSFFEQGYGMWSPYLAVTLANPAIATATITPSQALEEINLQGSVLTLTLANTAFTDASLLASSFTLGGAPVGLSVSGVAYVNATTALLTLAFNQTDFDDNYPAFSVTVADAEITAAYNVASTPVAITAHVEGLASIALDGGLVRLTVVPVSGAVSYRIFASGDPYGTYTEISGSGEFDPGQPNIWRIDPLLSARKFFRVSAIRS